MGTPCRCATLARSQIQIRPICLISGPISGPSEYSAYMKQLGHANEVCACGATGSHDHDGHCANHDGAECWYCECNAYDIDNCKYCKGSGWQAGR